MRVQSADNVYDADQMSHTFAFSCDEIPLDEHRVTTSSLWRRQDSQMIRVLETRSHLHRDSSTHNEARDQPSRLSYECKYFFQRA
jgi:hypothetical protein